MKKLGLISAIALSMLIMAFMVACDDATSGTDTTTTTTTSHTVVFDAGGGTIETPVVNVESGAQVPEPASATLSHTCYATMEGWYTDSQFTDRFDFTTPITDTMTLYAHWTTPNDVPQANADGTYFICGWKQLQWAAAHGEESTVKTTRYDYDYLLISDITFPSPGADGFPAHGFVPIGDPSNPFTGTFDGNGHIITNFFLDATVASWPGTATTHIGLFGKVSGADASVMNLTVAVPNLSTRKGTSGVIAGELTGGKVINVAVTGSGAVYGCGSRTGGLVGTNNGGTVHGYVAEVIVGDRLATTVCSYIGGLVAANSYGTVIGYFSGETRTAGIHVGGLAGVNGDPLDSSKKGVVVGYVSGKVVGGSDTGPVVGSNHHDSTVYAYWDKTSTEHSSSGVGTAISDIDEVYWKDGLYYDPDNGNTVFDNPTFLKYFSSPQNIGQWPFLSVLVP